MSKSKHTEAQMIAALKQVEAGRKVEDVAREFGVSKHTIYAWKAKYGGERDVGDEICEDTRLATQSLENWKRKLSATALAAAQHS